VTSRWHHISAFVYYGFYHWRDIWWNVKTHQLIIVLIDPKNRLIRHAVFSCDTVPTTLQKSFSWLSRTKWIVFPD